jgi:hypothetical protein
MRTIASSMDSNVQPSWSRIAPEMSLTLDPDFK